MQVKFDSLNRYETPLFSLCNPGSIHSDGALTKVIGILSDTSAEEISFNFNAPSELSFRIDKISRADEDINNSILNNYKDIKNRRLIFVEDIGYFVITDVVEGYDDGKDFKDITAESCEVEFREKQLPYIKDDTYKFNELLSKIISLMPLWSVGSIASSVADRHRTFEGVSDDENCLNFMLHDMQDAYECIFIFDIINRKITVFDQNDYVKNTNIHITKDDLINSIEITESSEDLYTAITARSSDEVVISALNPIGSNTIYDFSNYIGWLSPTLSQKVTTWQQTVLSKESEYAALSLQYYTELENKSTLKSEIDRLGIVLKMYTRCRENIIAESGLSSVPTYNKAITQSGGTAVNISQEVSAALSQIRSLISECESLVSTAESNIRQSETKLSNLKSRLDAISIPISIVNYFTQDEQAELSHYIYEGSYTDDYVKITEKMTPIERFAQMKTLYNRAKQTLSKASKPTQEFSLNIENFIFAKEFSEWSAQLETGCLINVEIEQDDVAALFLSNMTINYDDHDLSMTFGNRFNRFDPKSLFDDTLGKINKSANTLNYINDLVHPIKDGEFNYLREALITSRNLTAGDALSASNEKVIIDETGYTGKKILPNGDIDPRQVKIVGNSIVFTDDGWETCKAALGQIVLPDGSVTYGVNTESLIGNLIIGNQLKIVDKDGREIFTVMDDKISQSISSVQTNIDNTVKEIKKLYATNSSPTVPPTSGWSITPPAEHTPGIYIWEKTETTKTSGEVSQTVPVCVSGKDGSDGVGLKKATITYAKSQFGTEPPPNGWHSSTPALSAGDFLWTKTVWEYTDGSSNTGYSVSKIGQDGQQGAKGEDGYTPQKGVDYFDGTPAIQWTISTDGYWVKDGVKTSDKAVGTDGADGTDGVSITSMTPEYYLSASPDSSTGGAWSETPPTYESGKYIWIRYKISKSDGSIAYTSEKYDAALTQASEAAIRAQTTAAQAINEITEVAASIQQTATDITLSVVQDYAKTSDLEQYKTEVQNFFILDSEGVNVEFKRLSELITQYDTELTEQKRWIRFIDGKIHIGEEGNPISTVYDNDSLDFLYNGNVVATFTNDLLFARNLEVENQVKIAGHYAWRPGAYIESVGANNLTLVWLP